MWPDVSVSAKEGGQTIRRVRLQQLYDCESICRRTTTSEGDMSMRRACRCSLPGFDSSTWDRAANPGAAEEAEQLAGTVRMAALARRLHLDFDLDRDGCPYGWAVSHFGHTIEQYTGTRDADSPVRSMNMWLLARAIRDDVPDRLRHWVTHAEALEDGAFSHYRRVVDSQ
jgi:hypothetical protein